MTAATLDSVASESATRGVRALSWWKRHCDPVDGDPGTRARLRRCRSAVEALGVPAAVSLARQLGMGRDAARDDDWHVLAGLNLARVLAHVTEHDAHQRPMRAAGWKSFPGDRKESEAGEDRPRLSEARFRRLLDTPRGEEQVAAFIRLVAMLGGTVNVAALAEDFWYWSDLTKRRWAFDYYAAASATPTDANLPAEDSDE